MNGGCPFCGFIHAGQEPPADLTWHGPTVVSFTPLNPVVEGHRLFVPVAHVEDTADNPHALSEAVRFAAEWADLSAYNLIMSHGAAATQTISHLHVHVVPRREGDGLKLPWSAP